MYYYIVIEVLVGCCSFLFRALLKTVDSALLISNKYIPLYLNISHIFNSPQRHYKKHTLKSIKRGGQCPNY